MPKLSKRCSHSSSGNLSTKRLLDRNARQNIETPESGEGIELNADPASISLSFIDKVTLNDISDAF